MRILLLIATFFSISVIAKVPRQKIAILNQKLHTEDKVVKVDYFTKIPSVEFDFFDPYQQHKKIKVTAFSLESLFVYFAPTATSVKLKAINLYKVHIKRNVERSKTTYIMYKQDGKWLENSELGPMRIIRKDLGVISKDKITEEGADWIWMINEIEFVYE
ncbi:hypothetical protein [Halobacteriovorax sp. RT-2-4]|uniref:hypothetical protein n=1 Tax=unclassified Halobacteriovorax TaxID=2639665 RepID=UPI00399A6700